jgi:plastocyanin
VVSQVAAVPAVRPRDHVRSRRFTVAALVVAVGAASLLLPIRVSRAQGSVSGLVSIAERPGTRTTDLADAVVWLEPRGGGAAPAKSHAQIVMESREFVPRVRVVGAGSAVGFPNQDPFRHNVFSKSGPSEFDLGLYARGESKDARVERAGVYPVFCNIHAKMVAYIVAVPTPYVAQPNPDGRFTISGVPPGAYIVHAWHDRGGEQANEITVAGDGRADVNVQLDARGYRFVPHKNKFGQEYTNSGRDRY